MVIQHMGSFTVSEEEEDHALIPVLGGAHERRNARVVLRVYTGATRYEEFCNAHVLARHSVQERRCTSRIASINLDARCMSTPLYRGQNGQQRKQTLR